MIPRVTNNDKIFQKSANISFMFAFKKKTHLDVDEVYYYLDNNVV